MIEDQADNLQQELESKRTFDDEEQESRVGLLGADANLKNLNDLEAGEEAGDALKTDSNSDEEEES